MTLCIATHRQARLVHRLVQKLHAAALTFTARNLPCDVLAVDGRLPVEDDADKRDDDK